MLGQVPWPSFQTELFLETPHRWHELLLKQALLRMFFGIGWLNPNPFRIGSLYYIYVYLSRFGLWNNQATQWQSDIPNSEGRRLSDGVAKKRKGFCPTCECASCRRQRLNSNKKNWPSCILCNHVALKLAFNSSIDPATFSFLQGLFIELLKFDVSFSSGLMPLFSARTKRSKA